MNPQKAIENPLKNSSSIDEENLLLISNSGQAFGTSLFVFGVGFPEDR